MSNNAHELSNRLLNALDTNYNVVDMPTVIEVISRLEKFNITKELLETTRLGKHVNELRRKTTDPSLARRAKVLVKRWRDLVIPSTGSPGQSGSNRSSAERQVRLGRLGGTPLTSPALGRLGGTPLTSPALGRLGGTQLTSPALGRLGGTPLTSPALTTHIVSPAICSPKPASRPAWGGYESDSQDVILVDDDPSSPPTITGTPNAVTILDDKKAKRDKKPKKKRGHSRAGSETGATWVSRNGGTSSSPPRRNGCKRTPVDAYTALVNRIPPAGAKKVKTTKELLRDIQSRGTKPQSPHSIGSPNSPEVMIVDTPSPNPPSSPIRNGDVTPPPVPLPPLEDEKEYLECTCEEMEQDNCPAARTRNIRPRDIHSLHNAYLPGVNGTRAPIFPHQYAVRKLADPEKPELFMSVVPLYKYSDYAEDHCSKNMSRVPICPQLPISEWAPSPPSPPRPKTPPTPRPYPLYVEPEIEIKQEVKEEENNIESKNELNISPMDISIPKLEDSERLKPPLLSPEEQSSDKVINETNSDKVLNESVSEFKSEVPEHRTVERTKVSVDIDGKTLYEMCSKARTSMPYDYEQVSTTPVVNFDSDEVVLDEAFSTADERTERDEFGRPIRPSNFTEWHECAKLGDLIALPYVVID